MALYNVSTIESIVAAYGQGQDYLSNVEIDILPEENKIDPLEALRLYQAERNLDNGLKLAGIFCSGKHVIFTKDNVPIHDIQVLPGKPLQSYFETAPYLLDILCSASWGMLLKKLTPPSVDSTNVGGK